MDAASVIASLQTLLQTLQSLFLNAFNDPLGGIIIGGVLIVLGKAGRALTAAGLIIMALAALNLAARHFGIRLW